MRKLFILLLPIICCCWGASAQKIDTVKKKVADTVKKDLLTAPDTVPHLHSKTWAIIPPSALMAYGVASFYVAPIRQFDHYVYTQTDKHDIVTPSHLENYFQYAPVILTYGLNLAGVNGKNRFLDRTIVLGLSEGMGNLALFIVKRTTHRLRPNGADRLSFPSGHTTTAFLQAEFMAQEFSERSPLYGVLGYGFATTTGIFRIYHKDHWFSDVVAGAGLGILSTKAAYWLYPVIRNRLTRKGREAEKDRQEMKQDKKIIKSFLIMPSYQDNAMGMQMALTLR